MAMNAFVRLRQIVEQHKDIASRMEKLERTRADGIGDRDTG
jgi:hypothetical protein